MNWYVHITVVFFFFACVCRYGLCIHVCVCGTVCVRVRACALHRCAFFTSAYFSYDLRIHSVPQTELKHARAHTHTHGCTHVYTHGYNSTRTSTLHGSVRGGSGT